MPKYRVTPGCSVLLPGQGDSPGLHLLDYTETSRGNVPNYVDDLLPPDRIKALMKTGHVTQVGSEELAVASAPGAVPPGAQVSPPVPHETDLTAKSGVKGVVQVSGQATATSERLDKLDQSGQRTAAKSHMNLDPKKLKGKTLEQLNELILSRDPTLSPSKNTDEAVEILSKDFEG